MLHTFLGYFKALFFVFCFFYILVNSWEPRQKSAVGGRRCGEEGGGEEQKVLKPLLLCHLSKEHPCSPGHLPVGLLIGNSYLDMTEAQCNYMSSC